MASKEARLEAFRRRKALGDMSPTIDESSSTQANNAGMRISPEEIQKDENAPPAFIAANRNLDYGAATVVEGKVPSPSQELRAFLSNFSSKSATSPPAAHVKAGSSASSPPSSPPRMSLSLTYLIQQESIARAAIAVDQSNALAMEIALPFFCFFVSEVETPPPPTAPDANGAPRHNGSTAQPQEKRGQTPRVESARGTSSSRPRTATQSPRIRATTIMLMGGDGEGGGNDESAVDSLIHASRARSASMVSKPSPRTPRAPSNARSPRNPEYEGHHQQQHHEDQHPSRNNHSVRRQERQPYVWRRWDHEHLSRLEELAVSQERDEQLKRLTASSAEQQRRIGSLLREIMELKASLVGRDAGNARLEAENQSLSTEKARLMAKLELLSMSPEQEADDDGDKGSANAAAALGDSRESDEGADSKEPSPVNTNTVSPKEEGAAPPSPRGRYESVLLKLQTELATMQVRFATEGSRAEQRRAREVALLEASHAEEVAMLWDDLHRVQAERDELSELLAVEQRQAAEALRLWPAPAPTAVQPLMTTGPAAMTTGKSSANTQPSASPPQRTSAESRRKSAAEHNNNKKAPPKKVDPSFSRDPPPRTTKGTKGHPNDANKKEINSSEAAQLAKNFRERLENADDAYNATRERLRHNPPSPTSPQKNRNPTATSGASQQPASPSSAQRRPPRPESPSRQPPSSLRHHHATTTKTSSESAHHHDPNLSLAAAAVNVGSMNPRHDAVLLRFGYGGLPGASPPRHSPPSAHDISIDRNVIKTRDDGAFSMLDKQRVAFRRMYLVVSADGAVKSKNSTDGIHCFDVHTGAAAAASADGTGGGGDSRPHSDSEQYLFHLRDVVKVEQVQGRHKTHSLVLRVSFRSSSSSASHTHAAASFTTAPPAAGLSMIEIACSEKDDRNLWREAFTAVS